MLRMNVLCIQITLLYGVFFAADFILSPFSFEQNTSQGPQIYSITGSRYCNFLQQYVSPANVNDSA